MKVALCDDNKIEIGKIESYLTLDNQGYEVECFSNSNKLVEYLQKTDTKYGIYLISIEMIGLNGLQLAQEIRKLDLDALIIFISNDDTHTIEAFKVQTFDYLLKPIIKEQLLLTMNRAKNYLNERNAYFDFSYKRKDILLAMNEIIYISKNGRIAYIHTIDNVYKTYLKMSEILEKLNRDLFVRTHGSYVLNLNYVVEIIKNEVFIKEICDGVWKRSEFALPISRKFKDDLKRKYSNFIQKVDYQ